MIDFKDGIAKVSGTASSQEEKILLAVGNTQGVAKVLKVARHEPEATFYAVKSGDSLSRISKKVLICELSESQGSSKEGLEPRPLETERLQ